MIEYLKSYAFIILLFIVTIIIVSTLSYIGMYTNVFIERKIFEESIQYSESRKSEIATYEAQLAEINFRLNKNLTQIERNDLESQAASLRILLQVARRR